MSVRKLVMMIERVEWWEVKGDVYISEEASEDEDGY